MMFTEAPESIMTSIRCSLTNTWHLGGLGFAVRIVFQSENVIMVDIMRVSARLFRKVVDSVPVFARFVFRGRSAYLCKMASFFTGMAFFSFGWIISGMGVDTTTVAES
jgi:hypothetical protein